MAPLLVGSPVSSISEMLSHSFMLHAFVAGTAIAIAAGIVGYFLVLRNQVFAADALGHVAFTGALAALAFGVDLRAGLFAATVAVALLLGRLGTRARANDVVIGSVFAWVLGLGVLFLSIFTTSRSTGNGAGGVRVLFGSIFGLDYTQATIAATLALITTIAVLAIARPLLFASIDEAVAEARGIPVRALGYAFLVIVGITTAEATQAVGALLILGLLAAPGAAAQRLTPRPYAALFVSAGIALFSVWAGLALSYFTPRLPPSFSILAVAAGIYGLSILGTSALVRPALAFKAPRGPLPPEAAS
jgi:zinc/manganese transport system permease protein